MPKPIEFRLEDDPILPHRELDGTIHLPEAVILPHYFPYFGKGPGPRRLCRRNNGVYRDSDCEVAGQCGKCRENLVQLPEGLWATEEQFYTDIVPNPQKSGTKPFDPNDYLGIVEGSTPKNLGS